MFFWKLPICKDFQIGYEELKQSPYLEYELPKLHFLVLKNLEQNLAMIFVLLLYDVYKANLEKLIFQECPVLANLLKVVSGSNNNLLKKILG